MKTTLMLMAAVVALAFDSASALAEPISGVRLVDIIKRCTPATVEDIQKILFSARVGQSGGIYYQIHNAFRNREIEGIVIHVTFADPDKKREVDLDVFVSDFCEPLRSSSGTVGYFSPVDETLARPTFTLKEVYFSPEKTE